MPIFKYGQQDNMASEFNGLFIEPLNDLSEQELISRCQMGSTLALEELLRRTEKTLSNYIQRNMPHASNAEVEDMIMDVLEKAARESSNFQGRGTVKYSTWLCTVARNLIIDRVRRREKVQECQFAPDEPDSDNNLDGVCAQKEESFPDLSLTPEEVVFAKEHACTIQECLSELTTRQRVTLCLKAEGLTFEEIATYLFAEGLTERELTLQAVRGSFVTAKERFGVLLNARGITVS